MRSEVDHLTHLLCLDDEECSILHRRGPLAMEEIPDFFYAFFKVADAWTDIVSKEGESLGIDGLREILQQFVMDFMEWSQIDDERFFPMVNDLRKSIRYFRKTCENMAKMFVEPPAVREFYYSLPRRLELSFDSWLEGDGL